MNKTCIGLLENRLLPDKNYLISPIHFTSTQAPTANPLAAKALRAGNGESNNSQSPGLSVAHSLISASITVLS
ncbi:hypothetical protein FE810_06340 [Thalassotalea litorea]|uniref:Uncharacterized protein n=1 Tax=Thalassotalea litorea TaxID=2020715 RepID=A0A5R9IPB4_9GAMM|nr:hypothetical protein [Thalassotalea litorea]TLU66313.1 hypothetical protein FE810_06340 [Thalassotalea litorea]